MQESQFVVFKPSLINKYGIHLDRELCSKRGAAKQSRTQSLLADVL